jgi:hypothetical protein
MSTCDHEYCFGNKQPVSELSPRQKVILDGLKAAGALTTVFESGARMRNDETFPAREYMIGHAMRELINRLPDYYSSDDHPPETDVPNRKHRCSNAIQSLSENWRVDVRPSISLLTEKIGEGTPGEETIPIPAKIGKVVDAMVAYEDSVPGYRKRRFVRFLATLQDNKFAIGLDEVADSFLRIDGDKHAHVPAPDKPRIAAETLAVWDSFEELLYAIFGPRHEIYRRIAKDVDRLNEYDG